MSPEIEKTPMYLTTRYNGARAIHAETPVCLSDNVFVDPGSGHEIIIRFLQKIKVLGAEQGLSDIPADRMQAPPKHGDEGFILVISEEMDGGVFHVDAWWLLSQCDSSALHHGSPLMAEG